MDDHPWITIVLLTYGRLDYAIKTLSSTLLRFDYPAEKMRLHIASDGDDDYYIAALIDNSGPLHDRVTVTNAERGGYGKSYNLATQYTHLRSDLLLMLEDDWELSRHLDGRAIASALMQGRADCVRLGYIGYTQPVHGQLISVDGLGQCFGFDPDSPERHIFAGHPRMETVGYQRRVGPWPEGLEPGATEFDVAGRPESRYGVIWPLDLIHPNGDAYVHIGTERAR